MKFSVSLLTSLVQLVFGLSAIVAYTVLALHGESMLRWIPSLFLSVAFVILGILGLLEQRRNK